MARWGRGRGRSGRRAPRPQPPAAPRPGFISTQNIPCATLSHAPLEGRAQGSPQPAHPQPQPLLAPGFSQGTPLIPWAPHRTAPGKAQWGPQEPELPGRSPSRNLSHQAVHLAKVRPPTPHPTTRASSGDPAFSTKPGWSRRKRNALLVTSVKVTSRHRHQGPMEVTAALHRPRPGAERRGAPCSCHPARSCPNCPRPAGSGPETGRGAHHSHHEDLFYIAPSENSTAAPDTPRTGRWGGQKVRGHLPCARPCPLTDPGPPQRHPPTPPHRRPWLLPGLPPAPPERSRPVSRSPTATDHTGRGPASPDKVTGQSHHFCLALPAAQRPDHRITEVHTPRRP